MFSTPHSITCECTQAPKSQSDRPPISFSLSLYLGFVFWMRSALESSLSAPQRYLKIWDYFLFVPSMLPFSPFDPYLHMQEAARVISHRSAQRAFVCAERHWVPMEQKVWRDPFQDNKAKILSNCHVTKKKKNYKIDWKGLFHWWLLNASQLTWFGTLYPTGVDFWVHVFHLRAKIEVTSQNGSTACWWIP